MEVVPGKMGQRGIHLQAEKTPNIGKPAENQLPRKEGEYVTNNNLLQKMTKLSSIITSCLRLLWIFRSTKSKMIQ